MIIKNYFAIPLMIITSVLFNMAHAADGAYKPYFLASQGAGDVATKVEEAKQALTGAGFTIAGEYTPYPDAHIIIVTNDALKKAAAGSEFGGFGAVQRVAVTRVGDNVQLSYTNPSYMANMYRMASNLDDITAAMVKALGKTQEFGAEEAMKSDDLREYHYMFAMPYFDDQLDLAEYADYKTALTTIEKGLANSNAVDLVYRVDVTGKDETVYGVAMKEGDGADATVMGVTDQGELRHTAHLPYEFLVSGNKAYILHGKFRIAQSFPDLSMGTFMKISNAPAAIVLTIKAAIK